MTKFNSQGKDTLTYYECLAPAMTITDHEDAAQYLADYIKFQAANMQEASGKYTPEQICKLNLGYYAGYYDHETRLRVEQLFNCKHPVLGEAVPLMPPTPQEAFYAGVDYVANKN